MNITPFMTVYYEQNCLVLRLQNKPNSKPIQTRFKPNQGQNEPKQSQFLPRFLPLPLIERPYKCYKNLFLT